MAIMQFPGTNFHDLNLDWLLSEMKNCLAQWAITQDDWHALQANNTEFKEFMTGQWEGFRDFVLNYLHNLPLTEEVSAKIDQMVENGTLLELITYDEGDGSALSDVAGQWLAAHITQETGYVIDDSLTVEGAAADAKATGDAVTDARNKITDLRNSVINGINLKKSFVWEYGSINSNGEETGNTTTYYARTKGFYTPESKFIKVDLDDSITYFVIVGYNADGTYASGSRNAIAAQSTLIVELDTTLQYRFVVMMASGEFDLANMDNYLTVSIITQIKENKDHIQSMANSTRTLKSLYTETSSGCYSYITKEYYSNPNYTNCLLLANSLDKIFVTAQSNENVPIAMFYSSANTFNASTFIGSQGSIASEVQYTNEQLIIPPGTKCIAINNYNNGVFGIKRAIPNTDIKRVYCTYDGNNVIMRSRYTESSDLVVTMGYHGGNNLFDFISFNERNDDFTITNIMTNYTDFFGPYRVKAINNIDGDNTSNTHFTGGNHQYNNTGSGSTPTARGQIDYVLFDGIPVSANTSNWCDTVTIHWTNYIQGNNTKKSDGTGREILKEEYNIIWNGKQMQVDHVFIPLEDVIVNTYYGLQLYNYTTNAVWRYIGGTTRTAVISGTETNSGNKNCREIIGENASFRMGMQMFNVDLGDFAYASTYSVQTSTGKKAYFDLIDLAEDTTFAKDNAYYFEGCYEIEKVN